jgi:hypothetical protein
MKRPTWKELEEVVNEEMCTEYLRRTPPRYQKAMALALALARWRPERKDGRRGAGGNGLCSYDRIHGTDIFNCTVCPLAVAGERCIDAASLYKIWRRAACKPFTTCSHAEREEAADAMYNFLCALYKKEYERC